MKNPRNNDLISLSDAEQLQTRGPILIAHRGGVIGPSSPENSLRAMALAAAHCYDAVEIDVVQSSDGIPVLFHGWDLHIACGLDRKPSEMTAEELETVRYRASDQHITTLEAALDACRTLKLGVMLDIKVAPERLSRGFLETIAGMLSSFRLADSSMTFCTAPGVREALPDILHLVTGEQVEAIRKGGEGRGRTHVLVRRTGATAFVSGGATARRRRAALPGPQHVPLPAARPRRTGTPGRTAPAERRRPRLPVGLGLRGDLHQTAQLTGPPGPVAAFTIDARQIDDQSSLTPVSNTNPSTIHANCFCGMREFRNTPAHGAYYHRRYQREILHERVVRDEVALHEVKRQLGEVDEEE